MGFEPGKFRWPPLRLARVSRELVSVVVVSPLLLREFNNEEEDEVRSAGRAIGVDVHRDFCEVAIAQDGEVRSAGRVDTTPERLELFGASLDPRDRVALVSPADTGIRQARAKTDRLDARTLARLLAAGELDGVWSPDERCRVMRRRLARREQLVRARSRAKNEIHAVLVRRLVGRPPVSDLFGVKGRQWLAGLDLPLEESETIAACMRHVEFLDSEITAVERQIATQALDSHEIRRLMTVPGVNVICAATFMAAVGEIGRFATQRQLVGYLGLDPRVYQSGSAPATGGHISKQGSASARWALVEAAWSAVRQPGPQHAFYQRVRARRGHGIAVVASARKLACLFWYLLTRGEDYAHQQPSLTAKKLRLLEIRAGAPTLKGQRTGTFATRQAMRAGERKLAEQAEVSYKQMVRDWQAAAPKKVGASVTPGRASQKPSTGKVARQTTSP